MILPDKHIDTENSLIGAGAVIIRNLEQPHTITSLWELVYDRPEIEYYWRFILILDFLYTIGAIDMVDRMIVRKSS